MILCEGKLVTVKDLYHVALNMAFDTSDPLDVFSVRVALLQRRQSMGSWAKSHGILRATMHNALTGRRRGPHSRSIVKTIRRELGL